MTEKTKKPQGFAAMSPEKRREIAAKGGKAVQNSNRSFSKSKELAAAAGRKGGVSVPPEKRTFSVNRDAAVAAGRKGGLAFSKKIKGTTDGPV